MRINVPSLSGVYLTAVAIAADKTCITSFELKSKCYFFFPLRTASSLNDRRCVVQSSNVHEALKTIRAMWSEKDGGDFWMAGGCDLENGRGL